MAIAVKEVLGKPTPSFAEDPKYSHLEGGYDLPCGFLSFVLDNKGQQELIQAIHEISAPYLRGLNDGAEVSIALEPLASYTKKHGGLGRSDAVVLRFARSVPNFQNDLDDNRKRSEVEERCTPDIAREILSGLVERGIITTEQASASGYELQTEQQELLSQFRAGTKAPIVRGEPGA